VCTGPDHMIRNPMNEQGKEDLVGLGSELQLQPTKVVPLAPKCSQILEHQDTKSQGTQIQIEAKA
jgi:hypothetical protein